MNLLIYMTTYFKLKYSKITRESDWQVYGGRHILSRANGLVYTEVDGFLIPLFLYVSHIYNTVCKKTSFSVATVKLGTEIYYVYFCY
jgi:hypothetical protein